MKTDSPRTEINMAKIPADSNVGGILFVVGSMAVFLVGIPSLRYLLPAAALLGCGIALALHFIHRGFRH